MVTISDYRVSESSDGTKFCSLILSGDVELVKSKETGKYYATVRKTTISSTFDEVVCKQMVGKTLRGNIIKERCETYDYTIKETGEVIKLDYRYVYVPDAESVEEEVFA